MELVRTLCSGCDKTLWEERHDEYNLDSYIEYIRYNRCKRCYRKRGPEKD